MNLSEAHASIWFSKGAKPFAPKGLDVLKATAEVNEAIGISFAGNVVLVRPPLSTHKANLLFEKGASVVRYVGDSAMPSSLVFVSEQQYSSFVPPADFSQEALARAVLQTAFRVNGHPNLVIKSPSHS